MKTVIKPTFDLLSEGKIADVPYITGVNEDEGTLFAALFNTSSEAAWDKFFPIYMYNSTSAQQEQLSLYYPNDPVVGCPYRTGNRNQVTPQFKRFASALNDILFTLGRRKLLQNTPNRKRWTFFAKTLHNIVPILGTFHGNELVWQCYLDLGPYQVYQQYWIAFANHLDPGVRVDLGHWPEYTDDGLQTLQITFDGYGGIAADDFRVKEMQYMMDNNLAFVM